jgi:long-chain acyl-CoA synthetase
MLFGYWNRAEDTHETFTSDGLSRSGDVVRTEEDGYMCLIDDKKDMFLVSGFKVYSNKVEAAVMLLSDLQECACIGVPDKRSGEAPYLFVVHRRREVALAQIESNCRTNLAAYKVPRHITMIATLPKSPAGKLRGKICEIKTKQD